MASKLNGSMATAEWARAPPPQRPFIERFSRAIYDPDENSFFGRTPKRWAIVLAFYLVFYAVLAAMFAGCMACLFYKLDDQRPMYTLSQSLIGASPGVVSRPYPYDGVQFQYSISNSSHYDFYVEQLREFMQPYENEAWLTDSKQCSTEDNFGYPETPCFLVKINRIYDWKPEIYDDVNIPLPEDMPEDLKEYVHSFAADERTQVWVSCEEEHGQNSSTIEYPWGRGLPGRFYPYINADGYKSPVLAVKVTPTLNTQTIIRCRAWARNIIYNKKIKEAAGYTRILLQVEDHTMAPATASEN